MEMQMLLLKWFLGLSCTLGIQHTSGLQWILPNQNFLWGILVALRTIVDREILFGYSAIIFVFSSLQSLVLVLLFVLEK